MERRDSPRLAVKYPAYVREDFGARPRRCTIVDISTTGIGLSLDRDRDWPQEFLFQLSETGRSTRRCRVMWRSGRRIGARFLDTGISLC